MSLYAHSTSSMETFVRIATGYRPRLRRMTLPAKSFVETPDIKAQLATAGLKVTAGEEEAMLVAMDGPFVVKTGGKGASRSRRDCVEIARCSLRLTDRSWSRREARARRDCVEIARGRGGGSVGAAEGLRGR